MIAQVAWHLRTTPADIRATMTLDDWNNLSELLEEEQKRRLQEEAKRKAAKGRRW